MPIYSLEGTPGSGKSLYCVQKIIPDFLKIRDSDGNLIPRHIYTNIDGLKPELICAWANIPYEAIAEYFHVLGQCVDEKGIVYEDKDYVRYWYYRPESIEWVRDTNSNKQVEKHPDWEKAEVIPLGSLVIIDELQNYYSNRDFATIYSKTCIDFITKNRHYGWTLFWMSQNIDSVDVTFRRNTQQVWFLESLENFSLFGSNDSCSVKKYEGWLAGDKTLVAPFAKEKFVHDKKYYNAYKSYFKGVKGEKRYHTNVFLNHKGFMAVVIIMAICIVMMIVTNPLATLTGKKSTLMAGTQKQKTNATATATATPIHQSFSGVSGGAVVNADGEMEKEFPCYTKVFTNKGRVYVVLSNGKTRKLQGGEKYEECER